jgi:hypothetical protein
MTIRSIEGVVKQRLRIADYRHRWPVCVHFAGIAAGNRSQLYAWGADNQRRMKGFTGIAVTDQPNPNFFCHGVSSYWLAIDQSDLTP